MLSINIGYYNLRMIIFGKFWTLPDVTEAEMSAIRECQEKCTESASKAIDLIYDTFLNYVFFQTWYVGFPSLRLLFDRNNS